MAEIKLYHVNSTVEELKPSEAIGTQSAKLH